jgi:opacity protein-like surface antigen
LALKWTATELLELPFSLAAKGRLTAFSMESRQTIQTVPTDYKYKSSVSGLSILASKDFAIVEPYIGIGVASATGQMDVSGTSAFVSGSASERARRSSSEFLIGTELKLVVVKLGVEYSRLFGTDRYAGKLSFYF